MNKLIIRRVLVAAIGSTLIIFIGLQTMNSLGNRESPVRQLSVRESQKSVRVSPVNYTPREISLTGLGKVVSERAVDLVAEVQGQLLPGDVTLKRGSRFRQGQVLFRIDDTEASLSLAAQKSNFQTTIAAILPNLKLDHSDAYPTWQAYFSDLNPEKELADLPAVETEKLKVYLSTQNIFNQYYNIRSAEERLKKYVFSAPFSGSLLDVSLETGTVVNPGGKIGRIARSNRLELEVPIRTADLEFVRPGLPVDVLAPQDVAKWSGRITRVGAIVDPATQSVNVYISFNPGAEAVYEGQYLRADMPGKRKLEVMEIPRNAVVNQNQVYVVEDSVLRLRPVRIEKLNGETLYLSGLEKGTSVVVEPLLNAYENMPVTALPVEEIGS